MHLINPNINGRQLQIIFGTILGGSSITKSGYLSMRNKNKTWLHYKAGELSNLSSKNAILEEKTYRWHSLCYPVFKELRSKFYKGNKRKISIGTLDPLQDLALAIWFADCGAIEKEKIKLKTHIWGEDGNKVIKKYFKLLGYKPEIIQERKCFRILLDKFSSIEFLKLIVPTLPYFFVKNLPIPFDISNHHQQ
jgi:hypothetical protein